MDRKCGFEYFAVLPPYPPHFNFAVKIKPSSGVATSERRLIVVAAPVCRPFIGVVFMQSSSPSL